MTKREENYAKIVPLLKHHLSENFKLGLQLLKACKDPVLVADVIQKNHLLSPPIRIALAEWFRTAPEVLEEVRKQLKEGYLKDIVKWIPRQIIGREALSRTDFCLLVSKQILQIYADFDPLKIGLAIPLSATMQHRLSGGKNISDGLGWELEFLERHEGPAEFFQTNNWTAIAHHPNGTIKFFHECSGVGFDDAKSITWMQAVD